MYQIEEEFSYGISRKCLELKPNLDNFGCELVDVKRTTFLDYLFEREDFPLKDESVGFRLRVYTDQCEFTYKRFLRRENNASVYDEFNQIVNPAMIEQFLQGRFENSFYPQLRELEKKGKLYFLLNIENSRVIYFYRWRDIEIEVCIEDLLYSQGERTAQDAMLEIELKGECRAREDLFTVVKAIEKQFQVFAINEGKNVRAVRMLEI